MYTTVCIWKHTIKNLYSSCWCLVLQVAVWQPYVGVSGSHVTKQWPFESSWFLLLSVLIYVALLCMSVFTLHARVLVCPLIICICNFCVWSLQCFFFLLGLWHRCGSTWLKDCAEECRSSLTFGLPPYFPSWKYITAPLLATLSFSLTFPSLTDLFSSPIGFDH